MESTFTLPPDPATGDKAPITAITTTSDVPLKVIKSSGPFSLDWRDLGKGAIVAAIAPVVPLIQELVSAWAAHLPVVIDWRMLALAAGGGLVGYLSKNFGTPAQTIITPK